MRHLALVFMICFCIGTSSAQRPVSTPKAVPETPSLMRLPIRRIVLYKNGVGYFEHVGKVHGNQELTIDFTSAQLNDVLKSLTAVDLGEGRITGVRYDSTAPLSERMKTLRIGLGEQTSQSDFLAAMRGARVEVRSGASAVVGKILSVEQRQRANDKGVVSTVAQLSIVTDGGELRTFELGPSIAVRIIDRDVSEDVARYLNLIGSSRSGDLRRMVISTSGTGDRNLFVGYISEVPVWKSTYRILLPDKAGEKARLQGWAIVDNTVGEDWKDVQLSLVAGAAQSFIQEISKPYYSRRPVVPLPETVQLSPQSHEAAMSSDQIEQYAKLNKPPPPMASFAGSGIIGGIVGGPVGDGVFRASGNSGGSLQGVVRDPSGAVISGALVTLHAQRTGEAQTVRTDGSGSYTFLNVPNGPVQYSARAPGFNPYSSSFNYGFGTRRMDATLNIGSVAETVEVMAAAPSVNTESASVSERVADLEAEAEGSAAGDLFRYDIKQRITINKNQSALVPIINASIDAEKVSLWSHSENDANHRVLRALWLKNTSDLTLDSGTFNVLDASTFAGEGLVQTLKPGERRLISYAADTALHVTSDDESESEPVTRIRVVKGVMRLTREERRSTLYKVHNADTEPRDVVIEHPMEEGWKLAEALKPEETSSSRYRFRVRVDPGATSELKVVENHPEETTYQLTTLTPDQVQVLFRARTVPPALDAALHQIIAKKNEVSAVEVQINSRQQEIQSISADQSRVRENMKALKGSAEEKTLLQRYAQQLNQQEDRLAALKQQISDLQTQREHLGAELDRMVQDLSLDETM